jgi:hypothetical protein
MLEPNRDQLEIFVEALFRYAGGQGFVSLRAFYEDQPKPFRITPASLAGGLPFLIAAAEDDARRAANCLKPVVFCPPLATFRSNNGAAEKDIAEGLALSVECDADPQAACARLEAILGAATCVVRSGGIWIDPQTGEQSDKLHIHWRLAEPAIGSDSLAALKRARQLATALAGGDTSNVPVVHPIRWPGSWHRKAAPRLCEIVAASPDQEIVLELALDALETAAPPRRQGLAAMAASAVASSGKTPSAKSSPAKAIIRR